MRGVMRVMPHADTFPAGEGAFSVRVEPHGQTVLIEASGELDVTVAEIFEEELRKALSNEESTVVLDLAGVTFMDSCGLRALLLIDAESRLDGNRFSIRRDLSPTVERLLELTGCAERLSLVD
jgi:anti-anti-sigma factor